MSTLVLLRHGQSQWNLENRFTGVTDVPLTDQGKKDAKTVGNAMKDLQFDTAFTSDLIRAQDTLSIVLKELGQETIPIIKDKALNERHYGDLQGLNKAETALKYGQDKVKLWRRSYETRPPNGESIEDCYARVIPFFEEQILPQLREGKNVLVVAHGNSLRPILQYLDHLDNETTATIEIGLCIPHIYQFDGEKFTDKETREVPGIVTKGSSTTDARVEKGRV